MPPARRYLEWIAIFGQSRRDALYSDGFAGQLSGDDPLQFLDAALARADRRDAVTAFSLADLVTYLPGDLMTKTDIASMAHGLECRQPFLDHRVAELAARMPRRLKFRRGRGKLILRDDEPVLQVSGVEQEFELAADDRELEKQLLEGDFTG